MSVPLLNRVLPLPLILRKVLIPVSLSQHLHQPSLLAITES